MNGPGEPLIDETDVAILEQLAELYAAVDPVPAGLVERARFAVALDEIDVAMLRLVEETTLAAGARGERGRIFTFANSITLTIRIVGLTDETVRIDGWLAPPAAHLVTLRTETGRIERVADEDGRFVFEAAPAGLAQFVVRAEASENVLVTKAVVL
jgi:hypothetical protein